MPASASGVVASPHVLHPGEQDGEGVGCGLAHVPISEGCQACHFCHGFYSIAKLDGIQEACGNGTLKASLRLPSLILCLLRGLHEARQLLDCSSKLPLPRALWKELVWCGRPGAAAPCRRCLQVAKSAGGSLAPAICTLRCSILSKCASSTAQPSCGRNASCSQVQLTCRAKEAALYPLSAKCELEWATRMMASRH